MQTFLLFGLFLAPLTAFGGLVMSWIEVSRLRRFQPAAFESGLTILDEIVVPASVTVADPNCVARPGSRGAFFIRRTVSSVFPAFPAGRVDLTSAGTNTQVRLTYGFVLFYFGVFAFFSIATMLTSSPILAMFVVAIVGSVTVIVRRERQWGRIAATAVGVFNQPPNTAQATRGRSS